MILQQAKRATALIAFGLFLSIGLTSCQNLLRYHLIEPARDWQARSGQLLYRGPKVRLIGEVLVRYSKAGDFELTLTKGPGVPLFTLHQNADFARVQGPLARGTWSGPVAHAPKRLRGWLALREVLMHTSDASVKHSEGAETFVFQF
ncbi:MAG: hypothetical protein QOI04_1681 [Verrucomicrobiota bacterium]